MESVSLIVFSSNVSRYMKFLHQYRVHMNNYDNPDFTEPPNFLREYETQVGSFLSFFNKKKKKSATFCKEKNCICFLVLFSCIINHHGQSMY